MYDERGVFGTVKPQPQLCPACRAKKPEKKVVVYRYAGGESSILKESGNFVSPNAYSPAVARRTNDIPPQNTMTKHLQATTRKSSLRDCHPTPPGDDNPGGGEECRVNLEDLGVCKVTDLPTGLRVEGGCEDLFRAIKVLERHDANPIQRAVEESVTKKVKKTT
ncbi:MAG: hypothetical protein M1144_01905 [Candidatus Thermoplasmatota archaeon]|nr:hypothetical protein [Candidatus Thermoplasmatota archaeon]MCL5984038.1 hypothetical protein [Candidatus Thermoplasmatota archaeon]